MGIAVYVIDAVIFAGVAASLALLDRRFVRPLLAHSTFSRVEASSPVPPMAYAKSDDARLRDSRGKYSLAEIAGRGSDAARAIALTHWVHDLARYTPYPARLGRLDALHLVRLCTEEK